MTKPYDENYEPKGTEENKNFLRWIKEPIMTEDERKRLNKRTADLLYLRYHGKCSEEDSEEGDINE